MAADDWWTEAADQFGLETSADASGPAAVSAATLDDATLDDTVVDDTVPSKRRRRRHRGIDWLVIAAVAVTAAFFLRLFVVQQFAVDGESMLGTLHTGDRVMVNKLSYMAHDPRHGDVVVLKDVKARVEVRDLIKRVVALPGETIEYRDCQLLINGRRVAEPYLDPTVVGPDDCGDPQPPVQVEPGHVFVMGDNRGESLDSRTREIGQIPYGHLIGRAFVVVWPSADWHWL
jgi:signal peptidase I